MFIINIAAEVSIRNADELRKLKKHINNIRSGGIVGCGPALELYNNLNTSNCPKYCNTRKKIALRGSNSVTKFPAQIRITMDIDKYDQPNEYYEGDALIPLNELHKLLTDRNQDVNETAKQLLALDAFHTDIYAHKFTHSYVKVWDSCEVTKQLDNGVCLKQQRESMIGQFN